MGSSGRAVMECVKFRLRREGTVLCNTNGKPGRVQRNLRREPDFPRADANGPTAGNQQRDDGCGVGTASSEKCHAIFSAWVRRRFVASLMRCRSDSRGEAAWVDFRRRREVRLLNCIGRGGFLNDQRQDQAGLVIISRQVCSPWPRACSGMDSRPGDGFSTVEPVISGLRH